MNDLLQNLDKLHTTTMGAVRVKRNLGLQEDAVAWCRAVILDTEKSPLVTMVRKGKNWYVYTPDTVITVNAGSYTVITAHKLKKESV